MRNRKKISVSLILVLVVIIAVYVAYSLLRPIKLSGSVISSNVPATINTESSKIAWPSAGQSAVGILGSSYVDPHSVQSPTPTASVAKLITALVVLRAKPLQVGEQGPSITLSANDVAIYDRYVAEQGSVVPVAAGEVLSEYQMLEAMLLPSANNMADSLAIWAYGSLPAYSQAANAYIAEVGLSQTHVGVDASGYDPSTLSTAHDMVLLGELALQNPIIAGIVSKPSITGIPLTVTVDNVNKLLGSDGINGIKTGNTTQAGGVFVSSSQIVVNGKTVTIVTALAGTPTLADALAASVPFIQSTHTNFQSQAITSIGSVVARYSLPWGGSVPVTSTENVSVTAWNDSPVSKTIDLQAITNKTPVNQTVGTVFAKQVPIVDQQHIALHLAEAIPQPSIGWRLLHPLTLVKT